MKKYRAVYISRMRIEEVEIERETAASVYISEGIAKSARHSKRGAYESYFDTWAEAHSFLIVRAQERVDYMRRRLELANAELGNIKGLKPPVAA